MGMHTGVDVQFSNKVVIGPNVSYVFRLDF